MSDVFTGAHFSWTQPETVWRQLLRPWFLASARTGWEAAGAATDSAGGVSSASATQCAADVSDARHPLSLPAAPMLLAPDSGVIAWIKGRLVADGIGCLGVHFHTPGTLRGLLVQAYGVQGRIALREDLHLLMGQAARSLPDNPVAQAAVLDPVALSRLCDRIDRADWRAEGFSTAAGRQLAVRYFELLAAQGLRTVADVERELLKRAQAGGLPASGYLLAVGFGCEHSDNLLLLRAAALSTRQPIYCLDTAEPQGVATQTAASLAWQASCEEYFGLAQPLADDEDTESEVPSANQEPFTDESSFAGTPPFTDPQEGDGQVADQQAVDGQPTGDNSNGATTAGATVAHAGDSLFEWAASTSAEPAGKKQQTGAGVRNAAEGVSVPSASLARAALRAWAQALAAHSGVDSRQRLPLQQVLRLLTFSTPGEEAQHAVALACHWLRQAASGSCDTAQASGESASGTHTFGGSASTAQATGDGLDTGATRSSAARPLRIGIILPGDGSLLGREIAAGLSALGIAHYDSLGHQPAHQPGQRLLEYWCAWQNSNQIDDLNVFLAELARQSRLQPGDLSRWERAVDKALSQTLCAEVGVVLACLGRPSGNSQQALAGGQLSAEKGAASAITPATESAEIESGGDTFSSHNQRVVQEIIAGWPQLPEQASFADFWTQTEPVLTFFGWPQRQEPLLERARAFATSLTAPLPRSAFIGWLRSVARVPGRTRNALGHEPFANVHLVTLAEAARQQWSHLCVVGMVHGQWPPLEADSALLDPERCAELNRRAERPSRFGQGQHCIGGGHTFLASARQHREAFDAAFLRLLGQTGAGMVSLSRYRFEPAKQQAEAFASEYFLRSVYAATGSLDIAPSAPFSNIAAGASTGVAYPQVALAYACRRDPYSPFDAYSHALSTPPPEPLRLSCSHWAEVLNRPAHAWYRYVLKVRKRRRASDSDFRLQSQGIWVHSWLNPTAERRFGETPAFAPRPDEGQWRGQVASRAEGLQRFIAAVYTRAGRQLPQWWQSDWSAALAVADAFAETLGSGARTPFVAEGGVAPDSGQDDDFGAACGWDFVGGEWPLTPLRLDLPGHPLDGLMLEGIADLLLAGDAAIHLSAAADSASPVRAVASVAPANARASAPPPALWVVDYKTGGDASLSLKSWENKGAGLQLVLYAFALRARGAGSVQMTMLRKGSQLQPQLELSELSPSAPIWQKLAVPMRLGIFGMRGLLRDPHSFSGDYPVATLGIDPVVLERKARLTLAAASGER